MDSSLNIRDLVLVIGFSVELLALIIALLWGAAKLKTTSEVLKTSMKTLGDTLTEVKKEIKDLHNQTNDNSKSIVELRTKIQ